MLLFGVLLACASNTVPGTVSGRVISADGVPADAEISIDGRTGQTDAEGYFVLQDISGGSHTVTATAYYEGGAIVSASEETKVDGDDVQVGTLQLPMPMTLSQSDFSPSSILIEWTEFAEASTFLEYRIYRGNSTALSEETGTLLLSATDVVETSFEDLDVSADTSYFYRVFVDDDHGGRAASNIVEVTAGTYSLVQSEQFTLSANVVGLAQGDGCLWIATMEQKGGYWDENLVTLSCRNLETGGAEPTFVFNDEYLHASGLAFDGASLWINYTGGIGFKVKQLDSVSGELLAVFDMENGVQDLDFDGTSLLLNNQWNYLEFMSPSSGAISRRIETPFISSTVRGVAFRANEIWLSSQTSDTLAILNLEGTQIGHASPTSLEAGWNYGNGLEMAFLADGRLGFARDARVYLFDVLP